MLEWFTDLFSLDGLAHFLIGVGAAAIYHAVKAKLTGKILVFKAQYFAIPMAIAVMLYIAMQTQQNANCVREFQQVLRDRSTITSDNDRISQDQRKLVYEWIHNLVFPPPDIAKLDGNDPVREKWAINLTLETDKQFRDSLEQQQDNDDYRAAHPLPPPQCGE